MKPQDILKKKDWKIRKRVIQRRIDAQSTFDLVWDQMGFLESKENVENTLRRSIENDFYELNIDSIINQRESAFEKCKKGIPERFLVEEDIETASLNVIASIKQAHEYYKAANEVGPLTKPVLLYYGMVSLSKALVDATYISETVGNHGLKRAGDNLKVKIERCGAYQTFRDTYIEDTSIYTETNQLVEIELKELLSVIPGIATEWKLSFEGIPDVPISNVTDTITLENHEEVMYFQQTGFTEPFKRNLDTSEFNLDIYYPSISNEFDHLNNKTIHIIDAHFLAMFILGSFARYKPLEWTNIIEGSDKGQIFVINSFLRRSMLDFPMLIYSEIMGIDTYFMPFARMV